MKTRTRLFLLGNIMILFHSCYSYIALQQHVLPEIQFTDTLNEIVLVNYFDYTSQLSILEKHQPVYHKGIKGLMAGISSSFSADSSVRFIEGDSLVVNSGKTFSSALLDADSVREACRQYQADLFAAIDSVSIFFDWETIEIEEEDGSNSVQKDFYLYFRAFISTYSHNGELIDRSELERYSLYKSRNSEIPFITLTPSLAKATDEAGFLAVKAGNDYANKFYPQNHFEDKKLYNGTKFLISNLHLKANECDKAVEILESLSRSSNLKTAEKARHNLSVALEACRKNPISSTDKAY